ncbi:7493_t:CDS:1, partial [Entrophospora sp. SA101]
VETITDPQLTANATSEAEKISNIEHARKILTVLETVRTLPATESENQHPEQQAKLDQLIKQLQAYQQENAVVYQIVDSHGQQISQVLKYLESLRTTQPTQPTTTW